MEDDTQLEWMSEYENDWKKYYLDKIGFKNISGMWTKEGDYAFERGTPEFNKASKLNDKYYDEEREIMAKLTFDGKIGINFHCHGDYPMYFVHTNTHSASRGYPMEIKPENMELYEDEEIMLKTFCTIMDIPYQDPKWILASYWG